MNAGSLFSGVGGLDLGVGVPPAWFCEYDKHCRTILERHWPGVPVYPDVRELDDSTPRVDVLHGGYPCQPFSVAGLRKGEDDPRHLWPHFARLIRVLRPRVVIAENVSGHLRLGFHTVLADLAALGMDVRWGVVRASDVGAPHQRARLFIVATQSSVERVDTDGRVHRRDDRVGHPAGRTPLHAGTQMACATDPLEDRTHAAADANRGRREQRDQGIRGIPVARENSAQPAADADGEGRERLGEQPRTTPSGASANGHRTQTNPDWGVYEAAIRQWEHTLGRPAPRPTDDRGRLMPEFVEWMMGFPAGWTDGASRTQRLKMLGNAVVPAQCAHALRLLGADLG